MCMSMMEKPFAMLVSFSNEHILAILSAIPINILIDRLSPGLEFIVNYPLTRKHALELRAGCLCFVFLVEMNSLFPLRTLPFCFRIVLKTPRFIIGNYSKYYLEDKWKVKSILVMLSPDSKHHHLWEFLILKSSVRICFPIHIQFFFQSCKVCIMSLYAPDLCVFGYSLLNHCLRLEFLLNRLSHSKTIDAFTFNIGYFNRVYVSLAFLKIFTQNMMLISSPDNFQLIFD